MDAVEQIKRRNRLTAAQVARQPKAMVQKMNDNSTGLSILKYKDFVNA